MCVQLTSSAQWESKKIFRKISLPINSQLQEVRYCYNLGETAKSRYALDLLMKTNEKLKMSHFVTRKKNNCL